MTTHAPHASHSVPQLNQSPSPPPRTSLTTSPISHSNSKPDFQDEYDIIPLTERGVARSGSPTPSEQEELKAFEGTTRRLFRKESWTDKKFLITVFGIVILIAIVVVFSVFQDYIIRKLIPAAKWVHKAPAGWLIPIALLIILSIPPLFGAEVVHILCGLSYGIWRGFIIVCVGTILGECITFYMFRTCLRSRAEKLERGEGSSPRFGALARVIREGGFWVALVIRFSAFPTHVITALFATCGVSLSLFLLTMVLSLSRQLAGVYVGVFARESATGHALEKDRILSNVVLGAMIAITIVAMIWLQHRMKAAALEMIRERRAREKAANNFKIKLFDPQALYDSRAASNNEPDANTHSRDQTPSPAPPNPHNGVRIPAQTGPAQIHVEMSVA